MVGCLSENVTEAGSTCCLTAPFSSSHHPHLPPDCHLGRSREDRAVNVNHICPRISSWTRCICLMLFRSGTSQSSVVPNSQIKHFHIKRFFIHLYLSPFKAKCDLGTMFPFTKLALVPFQVPREAGLQFCYSKEHFSLGHKPYG